MISPAAKNKALKPNLEPEAHLLNPQFIERAPPEKAAEIRECIADIAQRTARLDQTIANLP